MTIRTGLHLALVRPLTPRTPGCKDCLATYSPWVRLRLCLTSGHLCCCDSPRKRHARRHAAADGHPIVAPLEPGEDSQWCFVHEALV